jgi:hypothetical protein
LFGLINHYQNRKGSHGAGKGQKVSRAVEGEIKNIYRTTRRDSRGSGEGITFSERVRAVAGDKIRDDLLPEVFLLFQYLTMTGINYSIPYKYQLSRLRFQKHDL